MTSLSHQIQIYRENSVTEFAAYIYDGHVPSVQTSLNFYFKEHLWIQSSDINLDFQSTKWPTSVPQSSLLVIRCLDLNYPDAVHSFLL
jgi:hypothetical protein